MDSRVVVDLRIDPTWVVPVEPAGTLTDHAIIVEGERIVGILPQVEAAARYAARAHVALPQHVVIPGLVNAHTHTAMTLLRGIADDVPLEPWLREQIWPREARFLSAEFVHDGTLLGAAEMLLGGVTCCSDMYFHPAAAAQAYDQAGMRAMIGMPVLDFPTPYAADADAYLQNGFAARDAWKRAPRLRFALAPHAPYTVGDATWRKVVMYAEQLDLPIQTHVAETSQEVADARARDRVGPLARLARLGVTGPGFIAIHAVHLAPQDIDLLAAHGCHVVHCPASNMKLASGVAPVPALLRSGVNVALGTDGAASNNRLDMLSEMRLASLLAKVSSGDAAALPAHAALSMATIGGARALGLDAAIGSLAAGKQADLVALDLTGLAQLPVYDPVSHLLHAVDRANVAQVWIAGTPVVVDRQLVTLDAQAIAANARAWQARLQ